MLDPQLYQSRVASAAEISPVPTHGDLRQTDDPDPTDPSEKLGKIVRSERAQAAIPSLPRSNSRPRFPGNIAAQDLSHSTIT